MKKTGTAVLCLLCTVCFFISGCAAPKQSEPSAQQLFSEPCYDWGPTEGETITIWTIADELDRPYMQRAFERYETLTKNKLEIVEIEYIDFEETVASALASGTGQQPDVLLSYGGTNIENFNPDENFYDFTNAPWVDDLTTTSINQTIYNAKVVGLPHWEASISGTLYSKELFERYGLEVPQTQTEFMQVCEVLAANGITPVYLPYAEVSMLLYQFPLDTLVEDTETLDKINNGEIGYADLPQMQAVVQWYRDMADKGYFGQNYTGNDWDGMSPAMESEQYAMMLCWDTWLYTDFKGDASKFGLMPAFVGIPQEGTFEGPNLALLLVNRNSPHLEAAIGFLSFMADPYNYNVAFEGIYTAPVFKQQVGSISTPQYIEVERLIEKYYRSSTAWLRIRGFSQMDASYIQKYMSAEQGYTVQDCLADMDRARKARIAQ